MRMSQQPELFVLSPKGHFSAYSQQLTQDCLKLKFAFAHSPTSFTTWNQVISLWQSNPDFRDLTTLALSKSPYNAFFWETPPIADCTRLKAWECVMIDAPELTGVTANPFPFAQQFERQESDKEICLFPNLGGDALLVVPHRTEPLSIHAHLAAFLRNASHSYTDMLWQILVKAISHRLDTTNGFPLWISTSGLGVSWLHIRLDSFPKYYTYSPYRRIPQVNGHGPNLDL